MRKITCTGVALLIFSSPTYAATPVASLLSQLKPPSLAINGKCTNLLTKRGYKKNTVADIKKIKATLANTKPDNGTVLLYDDKFNLIYYPRFNSETQHSVC